MISPLPTEARWDPQPHCPSASASDLGQFPVPTFAWQTRGGRPCSWLRGWPDSSKAEAGAELKDSKW